MRLAPWSPRAYGYVALAIIALVAGVELARPAGTPAIATDSQVSVYHFQLLVTGRQIEGFIPTTPKPLLTVVFGVLHALGDWRALALGTIAAYVAGVVLAAMLAGRLGGPAAAAFAGLGTAMSARLIYDVGFSLATPWALVGWLGAGLAASRPTPRYRLAGAFLLLATLARLETILVTVSALACLVTLTAWRWRRREPVPREGWIGVAIALLAVPAMALHDLVVTGDPLYWTTVASIYSRSIPDRIIEPAEVVGLVVDRWQPLAGAVLLAIVGALRLAVDRAWPILLGALALGPLVLAALVVLAARGVFVDARYLAPPELATVFLAGIGLGRMLPLVLRTASRGTTALRRRRALLQSSAVAVALGAAVALVAIQPYWIQDPGLRTTIRRAARVTANLDRVMPLVAAELERSDPAMPPGVARLVVPRGLTFQTLVELGAPQWAVRDQNGEQFDLGSDFPVAGQVVVTDRRETRIPRDSEVHEIRTSEPKVVDGFLVQPLLADPRAGVWVVRIEDDARPGT